MNILTRNVPRQYLRNGNLNLTGEGYSSFSYGLSGMTGGYLPALPLEEGGYLVEDIVTFSSQVIMNKIKSEHLYIEGDTDIQGDLKVDGNIDLTGEITINGNPFEGGGESYLKDLKDVNYNWGNIPVEQWDVPHGYLAYWGKSQKWSYVSRESLFGSMLSEYTSWLCTDLFEGGTGAGLIWQLYYQESDNNDFKLKKLHVKNLDVDELSIGGTKFDIDVNDPWRDDILVWDAEGEKWVNKHTGQVIIHDDSKIDITKHPENHTYVNNWPDLEEIPYTPLTEVAGIKQYYHIIPNDIVGGHLYSTQRIAITTPTYQADPDSAITLQDNDSRRLVTYFDVRDDYTFGIPSDYPNYVLKTFSVSDNPTEVINECAEVELMHSGNITDVINKHNWNADPIKNLAVERIKFLCDTTGDNEPPYEKRGYIEASKLVMQTQNRITPEKTNPDIYFNFDNGDLWLGSTDGRLFFKTSSKLEGEEWGSGRDINHYIYDDNINYGYYVCHMLDTGNFERLLADSSGEFHWTVQRSRFLQNNYGTCYFTNDGKLYLYDYVNGYKGRLGFNADGHLVVSGIEGYYTKDELYTKDEIDTTVGDLRYEFNTNLDSLEARVNQKIEDKFDVFVPDGGSSSGGSNISKIDDRLRVVEGRLDDIELMLDKILGTETNTYLNNKLDEILEG